MTVPTARRRVRVWFGQHVIADYTATAGLAERYAEAMRRRFIGLRITVDDQPNGTERPVPCEQLWEVTAP
jgi:hypothetical protein